jgi:hypothetical protein
MNEFSDCMRSLPLVANSPLFCLAYYSTCRDIFCTFGIRRIPYQILSLLRFEGYLPTHAFHGSPPREPLCDLSSHIPNKLGGWHHGGRNGRESTKSKTEEFLMTERGTGGHWAARETEKESNLKQPTNKRFIPRSWHGSRQCSTRNSIIPHSRGIRALRIVAVL